MSEGNDNLPHGPIVVTGADGFAGRAVCAALRGAGMPVRGWVRSLSPSTAARADMLPVGDLTIADEVAFGNALHGARAVVHLAGRAHVMRETAADALAEFRAINVVATERLARASAAAGVAHFVFASSVKVNGEFASTSRPFCESDPPDPRDDYAASKWEAECALADVARDTGMPVTVLRLPLLYGPCAKGNVARLVAAVARGVPLPLRNVDNRRSLLGLGNFGSALQAVLAGPPPAPRHVSTYLLADATPVSTPELIRAIAAALKVRARLVPFPAAALHFAGACLAGAADIDRLTGSLVVDTHAFRTAFGWAPPRSLAAELSDMVQARSAAPL